MATNVLHVRRLANFGGDGDTWLDGQFEAARNLFITKAGIGLQRGSDQALPFAAGVVQVEQCLIGAGNTAEQLDVFNSVVPPVPAGEIVVFVVLDFTPWQGFGCAWHPPGQLGCMVKMGGLTDPTIWKYTLAHELGHVLGLFHQDYSTRLMYPSVEWSRDPPLLLKKEVEVLLGGPQPVQQGNGGVSVGLSEKEVRHELSKVEPDYRRLMELGAEAVPLLSRIYDSAREIEYKARTVYALSLVSHDFDRILIDAAESPSPQLRRAAAAAARKLSSGPIAKSVFSRLLNDPEPSVRYVAKRYAQNSKIE